MEHNAKTERQFSDSIATEVWNASSSYLTTPMRTWPEVSDVMSKDVATISQDETVTSAAKRMCESNISCIIAVDNNGSVAGILTETDLLKRVAVKETSFNEIRVAQIMSSPVVSVSPDLSVLEAGRIVETRHIKRLPILAGEQLVGIVTQTDLVRVLTSQDMWKDICEIMSRNVCEINGKATVAEAAKVMAYHNISSIVVMQGDELVGIFTERDILKRVIALEKVPHHIKVEDVMSSPVVSISTDCSVLSASNLMEKYNIRRLVVTEDKKLFGIITQTDIFMAIKNKLQKQEEENLRLLEKSPNNIYTMNLNGKITYINPALMKLLEVSDPNELIGQPFLPEKFWFDPEEKKQLLRELKLKTGNISTNSLTLKTCKGKKIYVTLFSTSTRNIRGEINGSQGLLHDFTDRKLAEETLQKANETLKEHDQLKNDFVMIVSHELRTPLTIFKNIIANTLVGTGGRIRPKLRKELETANEMVDRLAGIINDFLDIVQIESGKMKLNYAPLSIQSFVAEVVNIFNFFAYSKGVDLTTYLPDSEVFINADRAKIIQVLSNLIDNAVKFAPDHGGAITLKIKDLGEEIGIDVEDNGIGLKDIDINNVFNRFIQAKKEVGPGKHGTGLGLAICKELVELHGGRIWAENIPAGGARFCFTLPKTPIDSLLMPAGVN